MVLNVLTVLHVLLVLHCAPWGCRGQTGGREEENNLGLTIAVTQIKQVPNNSSNTPIGAIVITIIISAFIVNSLIITMVIIISSKAHRLSTIQTKDKDHENYQSNVYRRRRRSFTDVSRKLRAKRYRNFPDTGRCRSQNRRTGSAAGCSLQNY